MRSLLILLAVVAIHSAHAQTIMTIDGEAVSKEEFENIYKKNNKDSVITNAALDEYVDLFVNFKLKVREAESLKMDTVPDFVKELKGYRSQLARPYLVDKEMTDMLIKEAYDRLGEEVDASHILIISKPEDSPEDTLKAYQQIKKIRENILNGKSEFAKAAQSSSQDPSAKSNFGRLGYFTSLQMVYPFENAAYNTPVGEVSEIVRSRFGYHILKVHDRRQARGEVRSAHIMVKVDPTWDENTKSKAEAKIRDIYQELEGGETFENLAVKYSDDRSSSKKGGELPWFGTGKMVEEFENAAFSLEKDGQYSKPFTTSYGWHIVKRLEKKGLPSFEEKQNELKQRVNKDVRSQMSTKSFVRKVKQEYGYKENVKALEAVHQVVDSTILNGSWRPEGHEKLKKWMFKIGEQEFKQADFIKFLRVSQGRTPETSPRVYVNKRYDLFKTTKLVSYEDERLEKKYPEFKALMKEYRDGILLFELTDEKVWSKAVKDTTGLKQHYENNKDQFKYEQRVDGSIYRCKDKATATQVAKMLADGKSNEEIEKSINSKDQLGITIISGKYEADDRDVTKLIDFKKGISEVHQIDGQWVLMNVKDVLPPSHKPYDKIKGLVTASYQDQLEKEWVQELRGKYTVEVDKDVLYSVR